MKNCCKIAGRNKQTPLTGVGGIDVTNIHPVLSTLPEPDQAITLNVKIYFKNYVYYVYILSSPHAKHAGPKGLRAESARAVTVQ